MEHHPWQLARPMIFAAAEMVEGNLGQRPTEVDQPWESANNICIQAGFDMLGSQHQGLEEAGTEVDADNLGSRKPGLWAPE